MNLYDHRNRRVLKRVKCHDNVDWVLSLVHSFAYDGNNIVLERIMYANGETHTIENLWGYDLSDSEESAGGVGGLLAVSVNGQFYFPAYDNNGNVTKYIDESGNVVAAYIYNAFGKTISQTGPLADFFRHRFSTKYYDVETDLYYYGYRFYSPSLMRWINRDPIEEDGGLNLYGFCGNCPIYYFDGLGNLVITGVYPSQDKSPSMFDHFWFAPLPVGEEKWFERNYAGWLAEARRRFAEEIERCIDCKKTTFYGPSKRIRVEPSAERGGSTLHQTSGGNERKYGDAGQSDWSADKILGCFAIDYVTPVKITYTNMWGGKCRYSWSTEMYVYDVLGTQKDDPIRTIPIIGDFIGIITPERGTKRATWTLSGSGECDCNGRN